MAAFVGRRVGPNPPSCKKTSGHCVACDRAKYLANKDQVNADSQAWAVANPDKRDEVNERSRLKKYGLTLEQHETLLQRQDGVCAICHNSFGRYIHIDHDLSTGKIRGLLCHGCNVGLGHFKDRPDLLRSAALYLEIDRSDVASIVPNHKPKPKPGDGRVKVSDEVIVQMRTLRSEGCGFGRIGKHLGLSRAWVYLTLKRVEVVEGGGSSITTS
jgi:hypothetical protein